MRRSDRPGERHATPGLGPPPTARKEIASVTDIPIDTVMSRLARARRLLQRSQALQGVNRHGEEDDKPKNCAHG
jgi:hypothetical protein